MFCCSFLEAVVDPEGIFAVHLNPTPFTLYIWETPKSVLLQTVQAQMKCNIMRHFITVHCKGKKDFRTKEYNIF